MYIHCFFTFIGRLGKSTSLDNAVGIGREVEEVGRRCRDVMNLNPGVSTPSLKMKMLSLGVCSLNLL